MDCRSLFAMTDLMEVRGTSVYRALPDLLGADSILFTEAGLSKVGRLTRPSGVTDLGPVATEAAAGAAVPPPATWPGGAADNSNGFKLFCSM